MQRELLDEASESEMELFSNVVVPKSKKKQAKSKEKDLPLPGKGILSKKDELKRIQKRFDKKRKNEEISSTDEDEEVASETDSESESSENDNYQSKLGINSKKKKIEFGLGESKHTIPELGPKRLFPTGQYDETGLDPTRVPLREDGIPHTYQNEIEIEEFETGKRYGRLWMSDYRTRQETMENDPDYKFLVLLAGKVNTSLESLVQEEDRNAMLRNQRTEQLVRSQITVDRNSVDKVWQYTKEELKELETKLKIEKNAKIKVFAFDSNDQDENISYDVFNEEIKKFENDVKDFTRLSLKIFVYSIIGMEKNFTLPKDKNGNDVGDFWDFNRIVNAIDSNLSKTEKLDRFFSFFDYVDTDKYSRNNRFFVAINLLFDAYPDTDEYELQIKEDLEKINQKGKEYVANLLKTKFQNTQVEVENFNGNDITKDDSVLIRSVFYTNGLTLNEFLRKPDNTKNSRSTILWLLMQYEKRQPTVEFFWKKLDYIENSTLDSHKFFCKKQLFKKDPISGLFSNAGELIKTETLENSNLAKLDFEKRMRYHPISYAARALWKMQQTTIELLEKTIEAKKRTISDLAERAKNIELGVVDVKRQPELPYEHRLKWLDNPINSGVLRPHPIVISGISSAYSSLIERVPWVTKTKTGSPIDVQIFQTDKYMRDPFASLVATEMALVANAYPKKYLQLGLRQFSKEDRVKMLKTIRDGFFPVYGETNAIIQVKDPLDPLGKKLTNKVVDLSKTVIGFRLLTYQTRVENAKKKIRRGSSFL